MFNYNEITENNISIKNHNKINVIGIPNYLCIYLKSNGYWNIYLHKV